MAKTQKAQKKKTVLRPKAAKPTPKTPAKPVVKAVPKGNIKAKSGAVKAPVAKPANKVGKAMPQKNPIKGKTVLGKGQNTVKAQAGSQEAKSKTAPKVVGKKMPAEVAKDDKKSIDAKSDVKNDLKNLGKKDASKAELKVEPKEKPLKKDASTKSNAKGAGKKAKKKEEGELEDDFLEADDLGSSEIDEYAEELEVVESYSETEEDDDLWEESEKAREDEEVALTDAEGRRFCRHKDCDQLASVEAYCRYHYLLLWKKIQNRKKILTDGKLEKYIEDLTLRYPDKFLEMIKRDLRTEKDFLSAIQELELDDSSDGDFEDESESFIDEVRGMNESAATGVDDEEF